MDWIFKHKIASLIMILSIVGVAWYLLSDSSVPSPVLSSNSASAVPPDAQQLVENLNTLRAVSLSADIFSNSAFAALQDYSTAIVPEPIGRTNPFAPLSASEITNRSVSTSTH